MRFLLMVIALLTASILSVSLACAKTAPPRQSQKTGKAASPTEASMLAMVSNRATSSATVKQLRAMHIDIVRVRPDPGPADKNSLTGGFIVEAVVPRDILPKLKAMGYEITEVPLN